MSSGHCPQLLSHLNDWIRIALYISKKNFFYISYVYCFLIFVEFPTLQMYTELHQPPKGYFKPHGQNILQGYFKPDISDRFCWALYLYSFLSVPPSIFHSNQQKNITNDHFHTGLLQGHRRVLLRVEKPVEKLLEEMCRTPRLLQGQYHT